ncbi:hypothetical protein ONZ51_g6164 [Trametes cubensis]|uniref:Uncharacterized protein n=1 Tax=Trametes cubensis TaxID=1111947 RepID=A0AAD7TTQ2_9APHY|nr:hypothetical protein ONZ51_g6164 [Trametes cubensis]
MAPTTSALPSSGAWNIYCLPEAWKSELDTCGIHADFEAALQMADPTLEIRRLNYCIHEFKTLLRQLTIDFAKHDRNVQARAYGRQPLKPRWAAFCDQFDGILDESLTNATNASAFLRQYVYAFEETLQSRDCDNLKTEVENLMIAIDNMTDCSKTIRGSCTDLADNIRTFEDEIGDILRTGQDHAQNVHHDFDTLRADVETLRARLVQVTQEMHDIGVSCIACLSVGALSAGISFFTLSPQTANAVVVSALSTVPHGVEAAKKWKEARNLGRQLREGELLISKSERKYSALRVSQDPPEQLRGNFENLASKIDRISGIWHFLKADMYELHSQLSTVTTGKITDLFVLKLRITRSVYHKNEATEGVFIRDSYGGNIDD